MNMSTKLALVSVFSIVAVLIVLFGSETISATAMLNGGMIVGGHTGGLSWMWISTLVAIVLGLGALLIWAFFEQKEPPKVNE